jgi:hypothetical protein
LAIKVALEIDNRQSIDGLAITSPMVFTYTDQTVSAAISNDISIAKVCLGSYWVGFIS